MPFQPKIGYSLQLSQTSFQIAEHPAAPGMPYGQEGRQATVYQVISLQGERQALKVFKPHYRLPALVGLSVKLAAFADLPGLSVCRRSVLIPQRNESLLRQHPDLVYGVLMPWVAGPTWMEVLLADRDLGTEECLVLSTSLASVLATMEQQGLAHCDLSSPNVLLPGLAESDSNELSVLEFVDVEGLYGSGLDRPLMLPAGSPGYAHKAARQGLWMPEADRFAGAVLLAEMLGWCDPRVRAAAWGESYFDPEEMQEACERYRLLARVLYERWGETVSELFQRAWCSDSLDECATFGEWLVKLPSEVPAVPVAPGDLTCLEPSKTSEQQVKKSLPESREIPLGRERDAIALEQVEKWVEAAAIYSRLLTQSPSQEESRRWEKARKRCQEGATLSRLFDDGIAAYDREDWRVARELLTEVVRVQPGYQKNGKQAAIILERIQKAEKARAKDRPNTPSLILYGTLCLIVTVFLGLAGFGWKSGIGPLGFLFWTDTPTPTATAAPTETHTPTPTATWTARPTATATATVEPTEPPIPSNVYIEYVVDASNSMMQDLTGGQTKLEAVRSALARHWQGMQGHPNLGLRAFGHRYHAVDPDSCLDTELLAPAAQAQVAGLIDLVNTITAQGMSPLAVSLREVGGDFTFASGRANALILIVDGGDNCSGDPCQTIQFQREAGIRYPIYVAGLGADTLSREQLVCIAEMSGGLYRDARTESELLAVLEEFVGATLASEQ